MKISEVQINNWEPPGEEWWRGVAARPDEPLIMATLTVTLSWNEYRELLRHDENSKVAKKNLRSIEGLGGAGCRAE